MQSVRAGPRQALQQLFCAPGRQLGLNRLLLQPTLPTFRTRTSVSSRAQASTRQLFTSTIPRRPGSLPRLVSRASRATRGGGRRFKSSSSSSSSSAPEKPLSLSQRLKKLSREYGWAAVGVYFTLSALDFPFCFLAVRTLGTDRIGHWEHVVVTTVKDWLAWPIHAVEGDESSSSSSSNSNSHHQHSADASDDDEHVDHGYKEAEAANRGSNASIWTQLALAYAIHKSFIFIRVPLTAAVTPKVVKTLRGWGWNIGSMSKRGPKKVD